MFLRALTYFFAGIGVATVLAVAHGALYGAPKENAAASILERVRPAPQAVGYCPIKH